MTTESLSETLQLTKCKDGFWLYDETVGMNLSMRAESPTDALVEALKFYQERLKYVERARNRLQSKVDAFVAQFVEYPDEFG